MKRLRLPKLRKEIREGEMLSPWYGVAWMRMDRNSAVCFPIPLNIVASVGRAMLVWAKHGGRAVPWSPRDAYAQGLRDGAAKNKVRN